eukprot:13153573-Alexandrium_andersonii.AAC.1
MTCAEARGRAIRRMACVAMLMSPWHMALARCFLAPLSWQRCWNREEGADSWGSESFLGPLWQALAAHRMKTI